MIVAYLIHNRKALKACSLTCRTLYLAAVPHLHHTITLRWRGRGFTHSQLRPLSKLHGLGLIPFVKELRVERARNRRPWFVPRAFSDRDLHYFSAFTNVQTLKVQDLQIHCFIPEIKRYFKHFSPTLRSITLYSPRCTPRQLSYFLSIFSNLDNIKITWFSTPDATISNTEIVPLSTQRPRGKLVLQAFYPDEACTYLTSCGPRFCYMDLRGVGNWAPILLETCVETLETLRLYTINSSVSNWLNWVHLRIRTNGEQGSYTLLPQFNLSRLKVLRSLHLIDWPHIPSIFDPDPLPQSYSDPAVREVFSTITSPLFSELVIVLGRRGAAHLRWAGWWFESMRRMSEVRPFKLAFLLEVPDLHREEAQQEMVETLESVAAEGLLDFLDSPPTIRGARCPQKEADMSFPDFD